MEWLECRPLENKKTPPEDEILTAESYSTDMQQSPRSMESKEPISLEGLLYLRKGKWSSHSTWSWKKRFVFFNFEDSGSIQVYKKSPNAQTASTPSNPSSMLRTVAARLHRTMSMREVQSKHNLQMDIASDLPWIAKDVDNDPSTFVLEINMCQEDDDDENNITALSNVGRQNSIYTECSSQLNRSLSDDDLDYMTDDNESAFAGSSLADTTLDSKSDLYEELEAASSKGKPLRIYFRCDVETNEKALWLKAFSRVGRLSHNVRKKKSLLHSLTMNLGSSRVRSKANELIARDARHLDLAQEPISIETKDLTNDVELMARGGKINVVDKEFRVLPQYAYPHRWLTKSEMREEMVLPSDHFHDLRVPNCKQKEIGSLRVEVLQCLGLPKLDRGSDTDAVAYLVCGSYAFSTDVIYNRTNPMWLRKSRRACIFPLHEGYARLFVGVFDYEPRRVKDDFAGRVALDLARLRPRSTYDVTLPLRLSTHVYSRRRRGAVRLRFTLNWHSERDALLSYLPKTLRIPLPQNSKPNLKTTVRCADQKAFRNIAITVHGAHLPGRFTFNQMRAGIREINFTRKYIFMSLRRGLRETRQWQNPAMSAFVFLSWMHCVIANAFSLVPAYLMLFLFLHLMRNYARFCTDGPAQRGFVPPSWEELFMTLIRGGDRNFQSIEPLELGVGQAVLERRKSPESLARSTHDFQSAQYSVKTHKPKGKKLLQALGFLDHHTDPNKDYLEFPFADGKIYPRFTITECLATNKSPSNSPTMPKSALDDKGMNTVPASIEGEHHRGVLSHISMPDMDLHRMMRRDSSGTKDYDDEEANFETRRAILSSASKMKRTATKTATAFGTKTGLDSVVRPISSGIGHVGYAAGHVTSKMIAGMPKRADMIHGAKRASFSTKGKLKHEDLSASNGSDYSSEVDSFLYKTGDEYEGIESFSGAPVFYNGNSEEFRKHEGLHVIHENDRLNDSGLNIPPATTTNQTDQGDLIAGADFPDQDIDFVGPDTGRKLTDDLAKIKDSMHELTWRLFDDRAYTVKNPNALFFGESQKPEKWRKPPVKQMDKYLHLGQYSHSNPFVARVGTYVEPIIGSSYSFLCLFRALFNLFTWRDPMLSFWVSFFCGIASIVLFFFPWRIFLFIAGIAVVGPQNWAIRILREQGHLAPADYGGKPRPCTDEPEDFDNLPSDAPVFTESSRKPGNEPRYWCDPDTDPREIHHVVVPNAPLFYQRCNDWPPEPQYALVRASVPFDETAYGNTYDMRRINSLASDQSSSTTRRDGYRSRLHNVRRGRRKGRLHGSGTRSSSASTAASTAPTTREKAE